jgi:hypothetical protein
MTSCYDGSLFSEHSGRPTVEGVWIEGFRSWGLGLIGRWIIGIASLEQSQRPMSKCHYIVKANTRTELSGNVQFSAHMFAACTKNRAALKLAQDEFSKCLCIQTRDDLNGEGPWGDATGPNPTTPNNLVLPFARLVILLVPCTDSQGTMSGLSGTCGDCICITDLLQVREADWAPLMACLRGQVHICCSCC